MYCKNCGKQLSDEAFMCPECGTPTDLVIAKPSIPQSEPVKSVHAQKIVAIASIGYIISAISCIIGIIWGAFLYLYPSAVVVIFVLNGFIVLPAIFSLALCIYCLYMNRPEKIAAVTVRSVVGIVLSSIILAFLFVTMCIAIAA